MQTEIYKPMKRIFLLLSLLALSAASLSAQVLLKGAEEYFTPEQMPNMLKWLPAPPTEGSAAFAYDEAQYQWGKEQRNDKARAALAIAHASIDPAKICEHFSEAMGMTISKENTPAIYRVVYPLRRADNSSEGREGSEQKWFLSVRSHDYRLLGCTAACRDKSRCGR